MKILAIRFGRVGDVVLTWRAATGVAASGHEITLLTDQRLVPLFEGDSTFFRVIGWDRGDWKREGKWGGARKLLEAVRSLRQVEWDAVLDFQGFRETALLMMAVRARTRVSLGEVASLPVPHHDVENHFHLWRKIGIEPHSEDRPVRLTAAVNEWAASFWRRAGLEGRKVVAVNPGASAAYKQWSPELFGQAAGHLSRRHGLVPLVVWGPGEEEEARRVAASTGGQGRMADSTTLPQLAALLARSNLMLTNDSGPMHLGAAMGVPVVAVFFKEHSRPEISGPLGSRHRVWWVAREKSDRVDEVVSLADEALRAG